MYLQLELELAAVLQQACQADQLDVAVCQDLLPLHRSQAQLVLHGAASHLRQRPKSLRPRRHGAQLTQPPQAWESCEPPADAT